MKNRFVLLAVCLLAVHCGKKELPSSDSNLPETPASPTEVTPWETSPNESTPKAEDPLQQRLRLSLLPQPFPNQYFVHIGISGQSNESWYLRRSGSGSASRTLCAKELCGTEYTDFTPPAGSQLTYEWVTEKGNESTILATANISIPKDFEIKNSISNPNLEGVARLFLRPGSLLLTQGKDARYEVQQIIAEDATIAAFEPGKRADSGKAGRNGGIIHVRAQTATGKLHVIGIGEGGAVGETGLTGAPGTKGATGLTQRTECHWPADLQPSYPHIPTARPGSGDPCYHMIDDYVRQNLPWADSYLKRVMSCAFPGSNGSAGSQGFQGFAGGPGFPGGNSAQVTLEVDNPANFEVTFDVGGGKGGDGGPGGAGGAGGPGGDAGIREPYKTCPIITTGPQGPNGPSGPQGPAGRDGNTLPYCYKKGNDRIGSCS